MFADVLQRIGLTPREPQYPFLRLIIAPSIFSPLPFLLARFKPPCYYQRMKKTEALAQENERSGISWSLNKNRSCDLSESYMTGEQKGGLK